MTRDEAVQAIEKVLDVQGSIDPLGRRRALALFILDTIGFDQMQERIDHLETQYNGMYDWRDKAMRLSEDRNTLAGDLEKAHTGVLALRDLVMDFDPSLTDGELYDKVLADTEHYEQYR